MTINIADNSPRISYSVSQGVTQTSFAVPFEFFDDADLNVYVDGTLKTLNSDYTATGGSGSTGSISMSVTGATGGSTVVITRSVPLERTTDFPTSGPFQISALNTELDRFIAIAADLYDKSDRALQLTDYDADVSLVLPDVNTRKGKTLAFNESTGAVEAGPSISDVQSVSAASADIALVADNIAAIQDAPDEAAAAAASASAAAASESTVAADAAAAATSETNAAASEAAAASSETAAAASEAAAAASETAAAASEAAAAASESAAAISETNAAASEAAAAASESAAATSETNAATSETNAASSATAAASSATAAASSATAASASADAALAALDSFDDRYLGQKASDPSVDNDGNPLVAGALYFNTTDDIMKVYEGSVWVAAYASLSGALLSANNFSDVADVAASRTNLGLGTAATTDSTDYAAASHTHTLSDITDAGTAAAAATTDFATAAQGALADSAIQPSDNISTLTNDAGYLTVAPSPFEPVTVSGSTPSLDIGSYNFFDNGELTVDTTVSFSNVPTQANWRYTFESGYASSYYIDGASYDGINFSVNAQTSIPYGIAFKPDGTTMYVTGSNGNVYQYSLSTPFRINTASYTNITKEFGLNGAHSIAFNSNGTKVFVLSRYTGYVYQHTLSTAYNISTASYDNVSLLVSSLDTPLNDIKFSTDGTKMFYLGGTNKTVYQYTLSTAFNLATASYSGISFSVNAQDTAPAAIAFKPDGTKMYVAGETNDRIYQYSLSTAFNVGTASYDNVSFSFASVNETPMGLDLSTDGAKMFLLGNAFDRVCQFSIGYASTLTIPASVQNPPTQAFAIGDRVTYDFYTIDGGTNVYLIDEEVM